MIRLNRFFTAKGAAEDGQKVDQTHVVVSGPLHAGAVPAGKDGTDLAARLRRAMEGPAPPSDPMRAGADKTLSGISMAEFADLSPLPPVAPPASSDERMTPTVVISPVMTAPPAASPAQFDVAQLDLTAAQPGPSARRAGRVRTRLLGFDPSPSLTADPIESARSAAPPASSRFPVGWIVVTAGPGRGAFFALFNGVSQIGRGDGQVIKLDFGDGSVSRSNHAAIAYDDEKSEFFLGHGGKTNLVRLNDRPLISTESLRHQDVIRIGETTLLFVALCSSDFRWTPEDDEASDFA